MNKVKSLFIAKKWPWHVLTGLCIFFGMALMLRKKPGCIDIAVLNNDLSVLAYAMDNCCRCAYEPGQGVVGQRNPALPDEDREVISEEEIEDRVNEAGGESNGTLTISLAWGTRDDIDLHVIEPGGFKIAHDKRTSPTGGNLDVDANYSQGGPLTTSPVENIVWSSPKRGDYTVKIYTYALHQSADGSRIPATLRISKNGEVETKTMSLTLKDSPNGQHALASTLNVSFP